MLQNRFHASIIWNMCFSHVGCRSYSERLPCAERWRAVFRKRFLRDTRLRIFKLDTFENVTFVLLPPTPSTPQQRGKKTSPTSSRLPRYSPPLPRPPPTDLTPTPSLGPNPPSTPWLTATCAWRWPPLITTRTSSRWKCTGRCLSTVSYSTGQIKRKKKKRGRFKASYRRIVHCIPLCS